MDTLSLSMGDNRWSDQLPTPSLSSEVDGDGDLGSILWGPCLDAGSLDGGVESSPQ